MFFTGFAFGAGWVRIPDRHWGLMLFCTIIVIVSVPLSHEAIYRQVRFWGALHAYLEPLTDKSHLGILRWVHLLALAYLMNQLFKWNPRWLTTALPRWVTKMGQQSLPVFLCCMSLSYIGGMMLDCSGRGRASVAMVNFAGLGLMLLAGQALAWLESKPWKLPTGNEARIEWQTQSVSAIRMDISCQWSKQVLLLSFLLCLAAIPLLLLRQEPRFSSGEAEIMVDLPHNDGIRAVNAVLPVADQEPAFDNQKQFEAIPNVN